MLYKFLDENIFGVKVVLDNTVGTPQNLLESRGRRRD